MQPSTRRWSKRQRNRKQWHNKYKPIAAGFLHVLKPWESILCDSRNQVDPAILRITPGAQVLRMRLFSSCAIPSLESIIETSLSMWLRPHHDASESSLGRRCCENRLKQSRAECSSVIFRKILPRIAARTPLLEVKKGEQQYSPGVTNHAVTVVLHKLPVDAVVPLPLTGRIALAHTLVRDVPTLE
jgi:hypothetical protein